MSTSFFLRGNMIRCNWACSKNIYKLRGVITFMTTQQYNVMAITQFMVVTHCYEPQPKWIAGPKWIVVTQPNLWYIIKLSSLRINSYYWYPVVIKQGHKAMEHPPFSSMIFPVVHLHLEGISQLATFDCRRVHSIISYQHFIISPLNHHLS